VWRTTWPTTTESDTLATVTARGNTTNSWMQSNSSMRAPLFYDSNNTGYYVNPASTSNLNAANFAGTVRAGNVVSGGQNVCRQNGAYCPAAPSGGITCMTRTIGTSQNPVTLSCYSGWTMTGGGCVWRSDGNDRYVSSKPNGSSNGWYCANQDGPIAEIWVRCCK